MASHPPIPVMELADHIERLKANDNLKFSQEYEVMHEKAGFALCFFDTYLKVPQDIFAV